MRLVFMGTPQLAADILSPLAQEHEIAAVYTRPDAVRGRGSKLLPSPVKEEAQKLGVLVLTPRSLRTAEEQQKLADLKPDVICVAAYGALLPAEVLSIPHFGALNVHASLLPRWRGAAPLERAILAGDAHTGVSIMRMEVGLDTGDFCLCRKTTLAHKSLDELYSELAHLGASALLEALRGLEEGLLEWQAQDESQVTYAEKIEKGELNPLPSDTAQEIERKVQASSEAHPARIQLAGKRLRLEKVVLPDEEALRLCSTLGQSQLLFVAKRLFIGTSEGPLEIIKLKPDGKKSMDAASFAAGIQGIKKGGYIWEPDHA